MAPVEDQGKIIKICGKLFQEIDDRITISKKTYTCDEARQLACKGYTHIAKITND